MADRWGWSRTSVRTFLNLLKTEQQIEPQKNNVTQILTIVNYDKYQIKGPQLSPQKNHRRTTEEPQKDPNKEYKEVKEVKEVNTIAPSDEKPSSAQHVIRPFLSFPVHGKIKVWAIFEEKIVEYEHTYPGVDVRKELAESLQWCRDNPTKQKTHGGMPRFINSWLSSAQNGASKVRSFEHPRFTFDQQKTINTIEAVRSFSERKRQ